MGRQNPAPEPWDKAGGGGGGHPDPSTMGGGGVSKKLFSVFDPRFGLKIGGAPATPGPSPESATGISGSKILDKKKEKTPLLASLALVKPYPWFQGKEYVAGALNLLFRWFRRVRGLAATQATERGITM